MAYPMVCNHFADCKGKCAKSSIPEKSNQKALKPVLILNATFFFLFFFKALLQSQKLRVGKGSTLQKNVAKCHKTGALFCYSASGLWGKFQIRVGNPEFEEYGKS